MRIAIIGATGLVGQTIFKVLGERDFSSDEIIAAASSRSVGKEIIFNGKKITVCDIPTALKKEPQIAIFSAGKDVSLEWAPQFANIGCFVVDNSSAWRMYPDKKLIVPEVNISQLNKNDKIIANPNCSTIQLVVVLHALHIKYGLKRVIVSTYQSVSGSGYKGINQLQKERNKEEVLEPAYPHQIDLNCIPHGGNFLENGYTEEEIKLTNESRKILDLPNLQLAGTVVRVPVASAHSESVNIEFEKEPDIKEIRNILSKTHGVIVQDEAEKNIYPMPINAGGKNEIFVGRIRKDISNSNAINLWIVSDNLRKGAATNAIQIAEYIRKNLL